MIAPRGCRRGASGRRRGATDRGFVAVEFAVLFPVVLVTVCVVIQLSFWGYRRHVAIATAQDIALEIAAQRGGDSELLAQQATNHGLGGLDDMKIEWGIVPGGDGAEFVQVAIDGDMPLLFGPLRLPIHARASAPFERFRA